MVVLGVLLAIGAVMWLFTSGAVYLLACASGAVMLGACWLLAEVLYSTIPKARRDEIKMARRKAGKR